MNRYYIYILLLAIPIAISAMDTGNPNVPPSSNGSTIITTPEESQKIKAEEDPCGICLFEKDHEGKTEKVVTSCNHRFHASCIDQWLAEHSSCPICRKTLGTNKTIYQPNEDEEREAALASQMVNPHQHQPYVAGSDYNPDDFETEERVSFIDWIRSGLFLLAPWR